MRYAGSIAFRGVDGPFRLRKTDAPAEKKEDADAEAGLSLSADPPKFGALGASPPCPRTAANYRQQVSGYGTVVAAGAPIAQTDLLISPTAQAAAAQSAGSGRARRVAGGTGQDAAVSLEVAQDRPRARPPPTRPR